MSNELTCKCGYHLNEDDISTSGGQSDCGEEYFEAEIDCPNCNNTYKVSGWGDYYDDHVNLVELLQDEINEH